MSLFLVSKKRGYTNATTIEMSVQKRNTELVHTESQHLLRRVLTEAASSLGHLGSRSPEVATRQHVLPETPPRSEHTEVRSRLQAGKISGHTSTGAPSPTRGPALCLPIAWRHSPGDVGSGGSGEPHTWRLRLHLCLTGQVCLFSSMGLVQKRTF